MNFVDESEGIIFISQITDFFDLRNITIHRINRFKGDHFGPVRADFLQFCFQIHQIIMFEDHFVGARVANAGDH